MVRVVSKKSLYLKLRCNYSKKYVILRLFSTKNNKGLKNVKFEYSHQKLPFIIKKKKGNRRDLRVYFVILRECMCFIEQLPAIWHIYNSNANLIEKKLKN